MKKEKPDVYTEELIEKLKKDYVDNEMSLRKLADKYNLKSPNTIRLYIKDVIRTPSEATKTAKRKYPESYITSEETKNKIRVKRLEWMQKNPESTAWRNKNISYPEKCFKFHLEKRGLHKKYIIEREKSVFPYFIDFAFIEQRVAVEIDGSQHLLEERLQKDKLKDLKLEEDGWRIFRVTAKQVLSDVNKVIDEVIEFVGSSLSYNESRVIEKISNKEKEAEKLNLQRIKNGGVTDKQLKFNLRDRKVKDRPSKEQLLKDIKETNYTATGKKYGVSDNCIRRWLERYDKYGENFGKTI